MIDVVHPIDRDTATAAAMLRVRHRGLRLPDAFVLAAGTVLSADAVLTADRAWAGIDRRVRMIT
jgi:PIN domain nuclease of toxin-antitoxin system